MLCYVMLWQLEEAFIDQKKQEALQRQEEEKRRERERLDEMKRREQERILEVHCVFVLFWLQNEWWDANDLHMVQLMPLPPDHLLLR